MRKWLLLLPPTPKAFGNKFISQISLLLPLLLMVSLLLITFSAVFLQARKTAEFSAIHLVTHFTPLFLLTTSKLFLSQKSALLTRSCV